MKLRRLDLGLDRLLSKGTRSIAPPEPADPFPLALFGDAPYAHYAAEDAGATWTARHGLPLVMDRSGDPVVRGGWLDCAAGCYAATREPWPRETAFELWALCQPSSVMQRAFYNGPLVFNNNPVSFGFRLPDAGVYSGNTIRAYDLPSASGPRSYAWAKAEGIANMSLSMTVHVAGQQVTALASTGDRQTNASGDTFVIGGEANATGQIIARSGLIVRDVLLKIGGTLTDAQRTALETYAQARLA
ncbi:MAG: hypothetical protein Q4G24_07000 [Paracoccus sp. (in: a-proteobacteria)]|uniref:hypothetical protein n=1 Tax=Paracoccus sp. TaxID=267 RepID=UPI0026DEB157|nr:hypothetical protein [Paracoccus sp. (in: a-proteobacteria)]MDO5621201.1 hypothetical protein [Paracoccus sp. (in: a-proteobacteria)]